MTNEELILKKLEEVTKKLEEVTIEMKEAREDRAQIKVSQAHHEGNLSESGWPGFPGFSGWAKGP